MGLLGRPDDRELIQKHKVFDVWSQSSEPQDIAPVCAHGTLEKYRTGRYLSFGLPGLVWIETAWKLVLVTSASWDTLSLLSEDLSLFSD